MTLTTERGDQRDPEPDGQYFRREISVDSLQADGQTVEPVLTIDQKFVCDVGCVVWDAALVLAKYLDHNSRQLSLTDAQVVELGAGTGFCSLMAAALGSQVISTDLSYCLHLIETNVLNNRPLIADRVVAKEYDWMQTNDNNQHFFHWSLDEIDFILVSDCLYYEQSVKQLYDTIVWLSSKGAEVLLSYEDRDDKQPLIERFFNLIANKFIVNEIRGTELHPDYRSSDLHLFSLKQIL